MPNSSLLKEKSHLYIETADEQKLQAIYTLLKDEINKGYSKEEIELFHQRRQNYLYNPDEVMFQKVPQLPFEKQEYKFQYLPPNPKLLIPNSPPSPPNYFCIFARLKKAL